jgi:hypothetical protein
MKLTNLFYLSLFLSTFILVGCTTAQSQSRKDKHKKAEKYEEDLSGYRIKYTPSPDTSTKKSQEENNTPVGPPQKDVTKQLNSKIDSIAKYNVNHKTVHGYRILVYTGRDSKEVSKARSKVYDLIPDADIYSLFQSPLYKVKVGNCIDRQEAYNLFSKLKKAFPSAVIVPDNVILKK